MNNFNASHRGISIPGVLFLGFILVILLSYFDISIKSIVQSPSGQENLEYVREGVVNIWEKYLEKPANRFWNEFWIPIVWNPIVSSTDIIGKFNSSP